MENYNKTIISCFVGYIVQAIINNFVPLLFLVFQREYDISIKEITLFVTINFGMQLIIDFLAAKYVDKIGYRTSIVIAHICSALGLIGLTILPSIFSNAYLGLLISVMIYAIGGGLIEVLVSPIVEACPTKRKAGVMSLLHSFYCFGHVAVVLISTIYFYLFGIDNWKIIAIIFAIVPIVNGIIFMKVPIANLVEDGKKSMTIVELFKNKMFWIFIILMLCAGASELGVSQWASTFAEKTLGVNKVIGDLLGPLSFATFMGIARALYGKFSEKIDLHKFMLLSSILCIISYLIISLIDVPVIALMGCSLCGFSVGILWPGTFSIASKSMPRGGTALFALLALAGDVGAAMGPTVIGFTSDKFNDNLKIGILIGIIFPLALILGLIIYKKLLHK